MIYTAIMGHGTVGSGVAEILINNAATVTKGTGEDIAVKYILDLRDFNDLSYSDKFTKDFNVILNDPEVKIVAEVMGGINPAYDFVKSCLLAGKSVVTSNKELVAAKGTELLKIAKDNNVSFLFEASVGGGIPIIRPLTSCLAANEIIEIKGILNGTTNYILNKMIVDNMDFDVALKLAQDKGFAEKDPTADIEGHDACRKICILAALAFGKHIDPESVKTEGITSVSGDDVEYADSLGYVIKLIGSAKRLEDGKITASVRPTLVSKEHLLSNVNGVFNAVNVTGDSVGDVVFYGKGAGKMATASAVVADVMDCAKHIGTPKGIIWDEADGSFEPEPREKCRLYALASAKDFEALKESFEEIFGKNTNIKNKIKGELAFITEEDYNDILMEKINMLKCDNIKIMHTLSTN